MYSVANNAWSKLAQGITADATSLIVEDASSFPEPPFVVSIDDEIIEVGSKTTNTFSGLVRGAEGTAPAAHSSGVRVENRFTAGTYQGVVDGVLTHLDDTENPHAVTAAQIGAETPSGAQAKVDEHADKIVAKVVMVTEPAEQLTKTTIPLGFRPKAVVVEAAGPGTKYHSTGYSDGMTSAARTMYPVDSTFAVTTGVVVRFYQDGQNYLVGEASFTDAGIEISWTLEGSPALGTQRRLIISAITH